jgi:hypothetical protein
MPCILLADVMVDGWSLIFDPLQGCHSIAAFGNYITLQIARWFFDARSIILPIFPQKSVGN